LPKILVTGGLGYIGSHTCVVLQEAGYEVVVLDNLVNTTLEVANNIEAITKKPLTVEVVDLCDAEGVKTFFKNHTNFDGIIHFAALKAVGESVQQPEAYFKNNVWGLMQLIEASPENLPIVFSSSCTVYGQSEVLPLLEHFPFQKATSPYGSTKQMGEELLRFIAPKQKRDVIALRYFNPIGAHSSALIGELPKGIPQNLVPFITQTAIGKRPQLQVFGDTYNTPDGSCIRDYIHVMDVAHAHVKAVERQMDKKQEQAFEAFNIGTGKGHSVLELVHLFEKATGVAVPFKIAPPREGDIEAAYADTQLSEKKLNWKAQFSIETALSDAWAWEKALHG
jgi:UDP-glucose 4-epimerase